MWIKHGRKTVQIPKAQGGNLVDELVRIIRFPKGPNAEYDDRGRVIAYAAVEIILEMLLKVSRHATIDTVLMDRGFFGSRILDILTLSGYT